MTVKQLKEKLEKLNENDIVIMSKDAEGNGFSPLSDLSEDSYEETTTAYGEVGIRELTPELEKQGYSEEDLNNGKPCVTLWPVN